MDALDHRATLWRFERQRMIDAADEKVPQQIDRLLKEVAVYMGVTDSYIACLEANQKKRRKVG